MNPDYPSDRLQQLPTELRWAVADEALLRSISESTPLERGVSGARLQRILKACDRVGMAWPAITAVALVELTRLLLQQRATTSREHSGTSKSPPERLFVGFGAGAEEELFRRYRDDDKRPATRLDLFDLGTFATLHPLGLRRALCSLLSTLRAARLAMRSLPADLKVRCLDFLTWIASRSAWYAYARAWFLDYGTKGPAHIREAAFLSVDTAAFAAVDAGLRTVYLQHGMLFKSLLFPDFDEVIALTEDEAAYLQRRLQNSKVLLHGSRPRQAGRPSNQGPVLFASTYCDNEAFEEIVPFLRWATRTGHRVICRPHPRENSARWRRPDVCGLVELQSSERSFLDHLSETRPRIVVSSFSTALIDALHAGIIPVTICAENDPNVANMVYPLFSRCLRWPKDIAAIERILHDDRRYIEALHDLQSECEMMFERDQHHLS